MKLLTLLIVIGILVIFYFIYSYSEKISEFFTPNPYKLSWLAPTNNGGDSGCCGYDWKICELSDTTCSNVVDSGTTRDLNVMTSKLEWATTYNIWVRATNSSGPGDWTKVQLSTGDGVVSSIVIGAEVSPDGTLKLPLSAGDGRNISVWTSLAHGSIDPNTLVGICNVTVTRGGTQVLAKQLPLTSTLLGSTDVFSGDFASAGFPLVNFQKGDVVGTDVVIREKSGEIVTEAKQDTTVTYTVPGAVTGITLKYSLLPPPLQVISKYQRWINTLYTQNPSPYKSMTDVANDALVLYNEMPAPNNAIDYQTKLSLFFFTQLKWVGNGTDQIFRGIGYFYVLLSSMSWDNASMAAAFDIYQRIPEDPAFAKIFNNGSGIDNPAAGSPTYTWGPGGINQQSYYAQVKAVLSTPASARIFAVGISTSPGKYCPTASDCVACKPIVNAPIGTQISIPYSNPNNPSVNCQIVACAVTSDNIPYWGGRVAGQCNCAC